MDAQYEAFCFADPDFYDVPGNRGIADGDRFDIVGRATPGGWTRDQLGIWLVLRPDGATLPEQGWKVHVAACPGNAATVLDRVWDYCVGNLVTFKFLWSPTVLLSRNSKYAAREASGKFVTIYPRNESELQQVCEELDAELSGQPGPYVLSDLRWGTGPLHLRYGGFTDRLCAASTGELVPAIERPDGTWEPDARRPVFAPPEWVELPDFLRPHLDARTGPAVGMMPYRVVRALHFSNGGGVYLAHGPDTTAGDGPAVVLKEARPHAGLDRHAVDAVTRLDREAQVLDRLSGIEGVPQLLDRFPVWEHHYIAMQHLEGRPLGQWMARHYPLSRCDAEPGRPAGHSGRLADYTRRALTLLQRLELLLGRIHARGVVYGDLHPRNILVDENDQVSLVDFELACDADRPVAPGLGAPGFTAPADRTGQQVDRYALAALRLFVFLPLNAILAMDPTKAVQYLATIEHRFPLPAGFADEARRELGSARDGGAGAHRHRAAGLGPHDAPVARIGTDWAGARDSLVEAVLLSATPARTDRLFPGDVAQFTSGATNLAHGAAGVLHVLDAVGAGRFADHERWLLDAVTANPPRRPGLYDGSAGVAWLLQRFGHHEVATAELTRLLDALPRVRDNGLFGGLAGIGTALLELATLRCQPQLADQAVTVGLRVAAALDAEDVEETATMRTRAGLLRGWCGPAMLFLALHQHTGDATWVDRAEQAIARDLGECVTTPDATLQVSEGGRRTLPYLEVGSAGIALALSRLATARPHAAAVASLPGLLRACEAEFVVQPGLFAGRAGLVTALATAGRTVPRSAAGSEQHATRALDRHLDRFDWHALRYRGRLAFPGSQLLRLSMDLATGGAGVLLAASVALDDHLPIPLLPGVLPHPAPTAAPAAAVP